MKVQAINPQSLSLGLLLFTAQPSGNASLAGNSFPSSHNLLPDNSLFSDKNSSLSVNTARTPLHPGSKLLDAKIIQSLIDKAPENSTVSLPKGVYTATEPIVLSRNGISLTGCGLETVIRLGDNVNQPLFVIGSPETLDTDKGFVTPFRVKNITIQDLVLDGNRSMQQLEVHGGNTLGALEIRNNCLTVRGAEDIHINRVVTKNARSGGIVLEKECQRIYVSGLDSFNNHFDGFAAYETKDSFFSGMNLYNNLAAGISIDIRFNGNVIRNSIIYDNGSQGCFIRDSRDNLFINTKIFRNAAHGVFLAQADGDINTAATGNKFSMVSITNSGSEGFRINDASCKGNLIDSLSTVKGNDKGDISIAAGLSSPQAEYSFNK